MTILAGPGQISVVIVSPLAWLCAWCNLKCLPFPALISYHSDFREKQMASLIISLKPEIIGRCRAETLRVGAGPAAPQELPLHGRPDSVNSEGLAWKDTETGGHPAASLRSQEF